MINSLKKQFGLQNAREDEDRYFSPDLKKPLQLSIKTEKNITTHTYTNDIGGTIEVIMVQK